jgi:hypothetical protein
MPGARGFDLARLLAFHHLRDGRDVLIGGAAAAADDIEPAVAREAVELLGQRFGRLQIESVFIGRPAFG